MITNRSITAIAILSAASLLGACAAEKTEVAPASFDTPPNWLDRVSVVAYLPMPDQGAPALGDYEDEPSRFVFRGVPLAPMDENDETGVAEEGGLPEGITSSQSFSPPG